MLPFGAFQEDATQPPFPRARTTDGAKSCPTATSAPAVLRTAVPSAAQQRPTARLRWDDAGTRTARGAAAGTGPHVSAFLRAGAGRASAEPLPSASGRQEAAWGGEDGHRGSPATLEPRRTCSPHQRGRGVSGKRGGAESASLEFRPWSVARSWTPSLRMSHDMTCPQANPKHGEGLAPSGGAGLR